MRIRKRRTRKLTENQKKVVDFIIRFFRERGSLPSCGEIARRALPKRISTASAVSYVHRIAHQGYLEILDQDDPDRARSRAARRGPLYRIPLRFAPAEIPLLSSLLTKTRSGKTIKLMHPDVALDGRKEGLFGVQLTAPNADPPIPTGSILICEVGGPTASQIVVESGAKISVRRIPKGTRDAVNLRAVVWVP
jgi:hypothetical protein